MWGDPKTIQKQSQKILKQVQKIIRTDVACTESSSYTDGIFSKLCLLQKTIWTSKKSETFFGRPIMVWTPRIYWMSPKVFSHPKINQRPKILGRHFSKMVSPPNFALFNFWKVWGKAERTVFSEWIVTLKIVVRRIVYTDRLYGEDKIMYWSEVLSYVLSFEPLNINDNNIKCNEKVSCSKGQKGRKISDVPWSSFGGLESFRSASFFSVIASIFSEMVVVNADSTISERPALADFALFDSIELNKIVFWWNFFWKFFFWNLVFEKPHDVVGGHCKYFFML